MWPVTYSWYAGTLGGRFIPGATAGDALRARRGARVPTAGDALLAPACTYMERIAIGPGVCAQAVGNRAFLSPGVLSENP